MHTAVTKRGQTVIPAPIRKRYGIGAGTKLAWIDDGKMIRVIPVPDDPIAALRGSAKGEGLLKALLEERRRDREREAR